MNKFHAKSKCFAVVFLLLCAAIDLSAQSGWVVNTSPSPWGNKYGVLKKGNQGGGYGTGTEKIHIDYDAAGNRILRDWDDIILKTYNNGKDDKAIGDVVKKYSEINALDIAQIVVYPNPTANNIIVEQTGAALLQNGVVELYDATGKQLIFQSASKTSDLDLSSYPSGTYLLILRSDNTTAQWKINKI